jgi:death-on-curing protein
METLYPTSEEIVEINKKIGANGAMINRNNLEFTLEKARNAKTLFRKATIILEGIITGHPFVDGNKRTAFITMELFLKKNGKELEHSKADEHLMERILYDIAENKIKEESIERVLSELIK